MLYQDLPESEKVVGVRVRRNPATWNHFTQDHDENGQETTGTVTIISTPYTACKHWVHVNWDGGNFENYPPEQLLVIFGELLTVEDTTAASSSPPKPTNSNITPFMERMFNTLF